MSDQIIYQRLATLHSATCFFNSLLREWNDYSVITTQSQTAIDLPLGGAQSLIIPLEKFSTLGRHQYTGQFFLKTRHEFSEVSFQEALQSLTSYLATSFHTDSAQILMFKERVLSSLYNIQYALEFRSEFIENLGQPSLTFKDAEQGLVVGHNFHPTPKSRDEFDEQDMMEFSPEFGGRFNLDWFAADPEIVHQKWATSFGNRKWTVELALKDLANTEELQKALEQGFVPVPMHPWQLRQLLKNPSILNYTKSDRLIYLGPSKSRWHPTSSLRSLYQENAPYMLKYSMSLKLTNSVRHLLIHEVERGLQLRDVLVTKKGQEFQSQHSDFSIITEPAYLCFKDESGNPIAESIIVCRENPFNEQEAEGKVVLATLVQDAPLGGQNLLERILNSMDSDLSLKDRYKKWFLAYLEKAVRPMLAAQANYGFLLGAHQQNLILDIKNGWPARAIFRDCQGTGYSELGYSNFATEVPSITRDNGNVLNEKMGNYLFSYYLIINSTFNVISALSASSVVREEEFLSELQSFLIKLRAEGVNDSSCLDYLLKDTRLMHKGNFLCAFKSINENTSAYPLSIYTPIVNPLLMPDTKGLAHA